MTQRHPARLIVVALVLATTRCASYPASPTDPVPIARLRIHYRNPTGAVVPGASLSYIAYAIDTDGVYEDVTSKAVWVSSDPVVARGQPGTPGAFRAFEPGTADIVAAYQEFSDSTAAFVRPTERVFPQLEVLSAANVTVGRTSTAHAVLRVNALSSQSVTSVASWTSSDPSVATVDRGVVKGIAPGTVMITAAYNGLSTAYQFSVPPFLASPPRP